MIATKLSTTGAARLLAGATFVLMATGSLFAVPTLTLSAPDTTNLACTGGTISAGVCTVVVTPGTGGIVSFVGSVGNWTTVNVSGLTYPAIGAATSPLMDLSGQESTKLKTPGNLTITFSQTGFLNAPVGLNVSYGGTDMATQTAFSAATVPGTATAGLSYTTPGSSTRVPVAFNYDSPLVTVNPGNPYGLTLVAVIKGLGVDGPRVSSFDMDLTGTPEPALYVSTGLGLLGLLFVARRRKMNQTEA